MNEVAPKLAALRFTVGVPNEGPSSVTWFDVGVPAGSVPDAIAKIETFDKILEITPNYVLYQGDVLVNARECAVRPGSIADP